MFSARASVVVQNILDSSRNFGL